MGTNFRKRISALLLSLFLLCAFVLAGCGEDGAPEGGASATYAVILKTLSNDFWATMKAGIEEEAQKQGVTVDIFAANSEEDTEGQLRIFENCIAKGYKAIGVAPLSPTNLLTAVAQANDKGIYVMNIDEKMDMETLKNAGGSVIAFATTDNVAVGEKAARYILDRLTSGGKVAIIEGKAGNASGEARKKGATEAFRSATGVELVASQPADWDRQKALDTAAGILQQHPDLSAFYCCNDTMALGALQAVKNAGKLGEVLVVGTDGAAEAVESVRAGELTATVAQDSAEIGAASLRKMIEAVQNGAEIDPEAEPETIPVDSYIVSQEDNG